MNPIICQIKAIAHLCVTWTGGPEFRTSELLSVRLALADALGAVDRELRSRREELSEDNRRGREHAEHFNAEDMEGLFG